jgi:hypothetical protein
MDPGALDSRAGVHVAGATEIIVTVFSIEASPAQITPLTR